MMVAARAVLCNNGVEVISAYPNCCGMPQLEAGDIKAVTEKAKSVATELNK